MTNQFHVSSVGALVEMVAIIGRPNKNNVKEKPKDNFVENGSPTDILLFACVSLNIEEVTSKTLR